MQIPILGGIVTDERANLKDSYPVNMIPVVMSSGISLGYLRLADGARSLGPSSGVPRGGINWNGVLYRVAGTKLVKVAFDGTETVLGDVGAGDQVTLGYSADRLAIASDGKLFYWDGITLDQVLDPDLGTVISFIWVDGYFVTTDGEFLIVTELNDPTLVNPLKYGSSEIDPDPIITVLKVRNEVVAVNRYTIEFFNNVGGSLFPFQRIEGAQLQRGAIGKHCACEFADSIAFLGSGRNEPPGIYMGINGVIQKLSSAAIDSILSEYGEVDLSTVIMESHSMQAHQQLWVRLPDRTLCFDLDASKTASAVSWFVLTSAVSGFSSYRIVDPVWCYDKWMVCDSVTNDHGVMTEDSSHHFGSVVRWEFSTLIVYNGGKGLLWNQLELVCLTGRVALGDDPVISTNYTLDGERWSEERPIHAGMIGDRMRRLVWFQQGHMRHWRAQRFSGDSKARLSALRLEVTVEQLNI